MCSGYVSVCVHHRPQPFRLRLKRVNGAFVSLLATTGHPGVTTVGAAKTRVSRPRTVATLSGGVLRGNPQLRRVKPMHQIGRCPFIALARAA